jgi:preprotein translocase subunit SecE
MNKSEVQTVGAGADAALVTVAILVALAGVIGFSFWSELPMLARVGILLGGLVVGAGIAWLSAPGKRFISFAAEAYEEAKRVTWPSRQETTTNTWKVFALVAFMSVALFLIDKGIELALYDWVLGWKR